MPAADPALWEHDLMLDVIADGDGNMAECPMRGHICASGRNVEGRPVRSWAEPASPAD